ncbi:MAG TPA: ABC transporter permease [Vicinamibacterales bacterium]|nr:ABC transporter permease [Vicinamibacterales bacterium]
MANQAPDGLLLATGMTFVILTGGIDLSVGSVLGLAGAVFGVLIVRAGAPLGVAVVGAVATGLLCGLVNGWISVRWHLPSFIVTLAMLEMARGATYLVTNSQTLYLGSAVDAITFDVAGGLGIPIFIAIAILAASQFVLRHVVFGRRIFAVGVNAEAARLAGIDPGRIRIAVFAISGALSGAAAVTQAARLSAADPNAGMGLELEAIAAVVIGGASLTGGRGSVISSALGAVVMLVLGAGLAQMGVQEPTRRLVTGAVIVTAAVADQLRRRGSRVETSVS